MTAKKTNLKIVRHHCESGSVIGEYLGKNLDYSWNSHELWINGKLNPEDHPAEEIAQRIFEECEEHILANCVLEPDSDLHDVGFTAEYDNTGITNLKLT